MRGILALTLLAPALASLSLDAGAGDAKLPDAGDSAERLERRLEADPGDEEAARELHMLLAEPTNPFPREKSLSLRELLRAHPARSKAVLVPPGEPGERLVMVGTVRDGVGQPAEGAVVTVFHTDASGLYSPRDAETRRMDEPNSRIFGFIRTAADGRYELETVRPGGYPFPLPGRTGDRALVPAHIHLVVAAPGYETFDCGHATCQLVFADDARMTAHWQAWAREMGNPVLTPRPNASGVATTTFDITLHESGGSRGSRK